jgi:curved DNA-binding protein CbpA
MDIQKALKLLDLEPGATLEDARAAFKKKAKLFHPDKLMAASKTGDDGEKMKDINVAYHTLKSVLKPGPGPVPGAGAKKSWPLPERLPPACRRLVNTVRKWIFDRPVFSGPGPTDRHASSRPRNPSRTSPLQPEHWSGIREHPPGARAHPSGPNAHGPKTFEDVLKQSLHRRASAEKRYSAYARYLELEKKMKQARRNNGVGRDLDSVEPVSRIKPVK